MELDKLREISRETGVKELWARNISEEVREAWEKAREVIQNIKNEKDQN